MRASEFFRVGLSCAIGVALGSSPLVGQIARDTARFHLDVALGVTLNGPQDVNQHPQCVNLGLPCESGKSFPDGGLVLQVALSATSHVSIAAEAGRYVNEWDTVGVATPSISCQNHVSSLLAGPRLMTGFRHLSWGKDDERYRAFAQILAGAEASTVLPTRLAVQPGAGIDVELARPGFWFRAAGDYRRTQGGPRNLSAGRALFAVVATP